MNHNFIFWAQALDNLSPDQMSMGGKYLLSDDYKEREKVVSTVSNTIKTGACKFEADGIKLTANNTHFVMEVISDEKDSAGRSAPIVCHGIYDLSEINSLSKLVATDFTDFANHIGRHLAPGYDKLVDDAFDTLKDTLVKKKKIRKSAISLALIVLLALLYFLVMHS